MQPTMAQMRMALKQGSSLETQNIGVNEAPDMSPKRFISPDKFSGMKAPPPGGVALSNGMPIGGIDMSQQQPGQQLSAPQAAPQAPQGAPAPQGGLPASPAPGGAPSGPPSGPPMGNMLSMMPQGQTLGALQPKPPGMAKGGSMKQPKYHVKPVFDEKEKRSGWGVFQTDGNGDTWDVWPTKAHATQAMNNQIAHEEIQSKKNGGGVQGYASKGSVGYLNTTPKNPNPLVGTRFVATPQGNLAQRKAFNIEKFEGKGSIVPIPYDATTRDNLVSNVSGHDLINPLLTEGGNDYSLGKENLAQNIGGASGKGIAERVQKRVDQAAVEHPGDVLLMPNTMGANAENFSHHPAHIILDLMQQRQLKKHTLDKLSDDVRSQFEINKQTKQKYYPYANFLGFDHPNVGEQILKGGHGLRTTPGLLRKKIMQRLGLVSMQKLLDYNLGDLKASILDPELATDPKAYMGHTVVKAVPGAPLRPGSHRSYNTDYTGENMGGMGNRPLEIMMPDVYSSINEELLKRKSKKKKSSAQERAQVVGALEKRKERFAQPINSRVINNSGLYAEGLQNGEFDPKSVESVLAYFKRKGGYKKGGNVTLPPNNDAMECEMIMRKKAK